MARKMSNLSSRRWRPRRVAHGHSGTHSYATVEVEGASVTGTVQFPISDLNVALGTELPMDESGAKQSILAARDRLEAYIGDHFSITDAGRSWPVVFTGYRVLERSAFSYAIFEYRVPDLPTGVPRDFRVTFDGIIEATPDHEALVIVRTSAGFGPVRTKHEQRFLTTGGTTSHAVTIPADSWRHDASGATQHVVAQVKEYLRRARKRLRR